MVAKGRSALRRLLVGVLGSWSAVSPVAESKEKGPPQN